MKSGAWEKRNGRPLGFCLKGEREVLQLPNTIYFASSFDIGLMESRYLVL
jgi:hypothetical protein